MQCTTRTCLNLLQLLKCCCRPSVHLFTNSVQSILSLFICTISWWLSSLYSTDYLTVRKTSVTFFWFFLTLRSLQSFTSFLFILARMQLRKCQTSPGTAELYFRLIRVTLKADVFTGKTKFRGTYTTSLMHYWHFSPQPIFYFIF